MGERIVIRPVTRIEGHATIAITVDDAGAVESARFQVSEFRGFEKLCEGRPFHEMPGFMSRVCGICPVSHIVASAKAGDWLLGVEPPPAATLLRRLLTHAQVLQSHALSFFHLSAPDLLLGMDAAPAGRNLFGLIEREPDFMRRGIRLRQLGQRLIELAGGKRIHPAWGTPGGVRAPLDVAGRDEVLARIPEAYESVALALERLKGVLDGFRDEVESLGSFPSLFLGTVNDAGALEYYDGTLRIVDDAGDVVADGLDPHAYASFLGEASEETSYVKSAFYRPRGYPDGMYRVGPLARLNVASAAGTPRAERELVEFKQRGRGAVCASFHFHLARLVEMLHAVERIEALLQDPGVLDTHVQARALLNRREGVGSCEAPRGTLFHHYEVDDNGLVRRANLLIATSQNNLAMSHAVAQAARRFVRADRVEEGMLNRVEAAIRCFDPCLSCSTHAIGAMPLRIEIRRRDGELLHRVERG